MNLKVDSRELAHPGFQGYVILLLYVHVSPTPITVFRSHLGMGPVQPWNFPANPAICDPLTRSESSDPTSPRPDPQAKTASVGNLENPAPTSCCSHHRQPTTNITLFFCPMTDLIGAASAWENRDRSGDWTKRAPAVSRPGAPRFDTLVWVMACTCGWGSGVRVEEWWREREGRSS